MRNIFINQGPRKVKRDLASVVDSQKPQHDPLEHFRVPDLFNYLFGLLLLRHDLYLHPNESNQEPIIDHVGQSVYDYARYRLRSLVLLCIKQHIEVEVAHGLREYDYVDHVRPPADLLQIACHPIESQTAANLEQY